MGILPKHCDSCGGLYIALGSETHCQEAERQLKQSIDEGKRDFELMVAAVQAYRQRGECVTELQAIAYHLGLSVKKDKFVWTDEELERIRKKDERQNRLFKKVDNNTLVCEESPRPGLTATITGSGEPTGTTWTVVVYSDGQALYQKTVNYLWEAKDWVEERLWTNEES